MKLSMANARSFRSESGFAMIEVVVSAAVLAIVALAVLSGIDGATGSSAREKARAVAANLAEQDQERLRAMSVQTLTAVPQAAPISVDGVLYTIKSEAGWVTDDTGGTPSCGNSTNRSEYFHITSTVTSNVVGVRVPAVKIDSLVSPTVAYAQAHGTFGAKVVDRKGDGIPNIPVNANGPQALPTKSTDQKGCVIWRSIPIGTYTATINLSSYVDETGAQAATRDAIVSPNTVTFVSFSYDLAAKGNVTVMTHVPGQTFSSAGGKPSSAFAVSDNMSDRTFPAPALPAAAGTIEVKPLFPFLSKSYGFFTGNCAYESPVNVALANQDYFATTNAAATMLTTPGASGLGATVFQPPVQIRVSKDYNNAQPVAGRMEIRMTLQKPPASTGDACVEPEFKMQTVAWPSSGWTKQTGPNDPLTFAYTSQSKTTFDPGMPFGTYTITCVFDNGGGSNTNNWRTYKPSGGISYDNTSPNGGALLDIGVTGTTNWQKWSNQKC